MPYLVHSSNLFCFASLYLLCSGSTQVADTGAIAGAITGAITGAIAGVIIGAIAGAIIGAIIGVIIGAISDAISLGSFSITLSADERVTLTGSTRLLVNMFLALTESCCCRFTWFEMDGNMSKKSAWKCVLAPDLIQSTIARISRYVAIFATEEDIVCVFPPDLWW
ncbi:hypothetical protein BDF14DRAFT_1449794 [Spinellus fusiger]|nr:hypothetical protein BDF14DRAFT_1449794 [Spinellus fusiger]